MPAFLPSWTATLSLSPHRTPSISPSPTSLRPPRRRRTSRASPPRPPTPCTAAPSAPPPPRLPSAPRASPRIGRASRDLASLAAALQATCEAYNLPAPPESLPTREALRAVDPTLANRIEAVAGRNGWRRLAAYVGVEVDPVARRRRGAAEVLRRWDDARNVLEALAEYQENERVLPCVRKLPSTLREAVRRQGGAGRLALSAGMLLDCEWRRAKRFAQFLRDLADLVAAESGDGDAAEADATGVRRRHRSSLAERVEVESKNGGLAFPSSPVLRKRSLYNGVQRYGGRRALGARLGFARAKGPSGIFMGQFSVAFAADIVEYAVEVAEAGEDGALAMPGLARMTADGRGELAALCLRFGGEEEVGRRLGLVPRLDVVSKRNDDRAGWLREESLKVSRIGATER